MSLQYCTFCIDDLVFGVEVNRVQEVVRDQRVTRVPLAPPEISGLINLRGQIVTAIDLRRRLRLPLRDPNDRSMNVMLQTEEGIVGLVVDQIEDVLDVNEDTIEEPPNTLEPAARELVIAASKLKDRLLLILDVDKAVDLKDVLRLSESVN